jgi:hypothetical protein
MVKRIASIVLVLMLVMAVFVPAASAQGYTRTFYNTAQFDGAHVQGVTFIARNQMGYTVGSCVTGANGDCAFITVVYPGDSYTVQAIYSPWFINMWSNSYAFNQNGGSFFGQLRMSYWSQDTLYLYQGWVR